MSTLNHILGNAGHPYRIEHAGRVYEVSLIDQRVKAGFEKRLFEQSVACLAAMRPALRSAEYEARLERLAADYETGAYDMMSPRGTAYMQTVAGAELLLSLLVGCETRELYGLLLEKSAEVKTILALVVRDSFPRAAQANAQPTPGNGQGQGQGPADPNP